MDLDGASRRPVSVPAERLACKQKRRHMGHFAKHPLCGNRRGRLRPVFPEAQRKAGISLCVALYPAVVSVLYPGRGRRGAYADARHADAAENRLLYPAACLLPSGNGKRVK